MARSLYIEAVSFYRIATIVEQLTGIHTQSAFIIVSLVRLYASEHND